MNDLRRATASLLAVSDSDEQVPMPTLSMSIAEFNNLLFQIASYDGFEGETMEEFAKAFAASLNGNAVIESADGVDNFPEVGEEGALYLDTNTGKIYYYEDGEYKQANADTEITEKEISEAIERILADNPTETNKAISAAVESYLDENKDDVDDIVNSYLEKNKDDIIGEVDSYLDNNSEVVEAGIVKYLGESQEVNNIIKNELETNPAALENGIENYAKNNPETIDTAIDSYLDKNAEIIENAVKDKIDNEAGSLVEATKQYLTENEDVVDNGIDGYLDDNKDIINDSVHSYLEDHKDELNGMISEHYEATANVKGVSDADIIKETLGDTKPIEGNVFIVKHLICDDKYDYTSYYYDGENWCAMSGNYNAENVYFSQDFIVTEQIGTLKDFTGKTTLSAKGKNLVQLLESLFANERAPQVKMPSITITNSTAKNYEVGTLVKPAWIAKFNPGEYEFNESTGVELESWSIINNITNEKATSAGGKFAEIKVEDDMNLTITAKATYSAGIVPMSNLDKPVESSKINAGSISKTSSALKGYRKTFFGTLFDDEAITPETIRDLESSTSGMKDGSVFSINVGEGATKVIIAYPAVLGNISSVKKDNKYEIADRFELTSMNIEGANGYKAIEYKVYVREFGSEKVDDCVYTVII